MPVPDPIPASVDPARGGWTLAQFAPSGTRAEQREAYRRFVGEARDAEYDPRELVIGQLYLGGEQFCDRMQALVASRTRSAEHPRSQRRFVRPGRFWGRTQNIRNSVIVGPYGISNLSGPTPTFLV